MNLFAVSTALTPHAGTLQLVAAAVVGIALIVVLITWLKLNPFLSLTIGSLAVGAMANMPMADVVTSFSNGVGSTVASVGVLIALGAMFGRLLADSGAADQIVDTLVGKAGTRMLPWAMGLVGALIGLPMFFEIGLVLLMPVIMLVSVRSGLSLVRVGIPALAGLSAMHGLVPPHPGPLVAIGALKADLGITLIIGVLIAIPVVVISGPLFAKVAGRWVNVAAPQLVITEREKQLLAAGHGGGHATPTAPAAGAGKNAASAGARARQPRFSVTLATVLLPVVLMMAKAIADIVSSANSPVRVVLDFLGNPLIALLLAVLVAVVTFGRGSGMDRRAIASSLEQSLPPIAGILLIVGAGGGFKQTLIDTGIGTVITNFAASSGISVLFLGWLVAVLIRLATGSATVATVTAAGVLAPLAASLPTAETSLLVLAIGTGSVFFSHVNDAGFWLVKEYFRMDIVQTIKTWSLMETLISVVGLVLVLAVGMFV
ncbi:2-keto-3-deoxygluconate permease [Sinomonas cyclohexanicum]|uniref:2-keto-3-deoxygluconate permease n=1 Tax=Sinomonas cyclohexanicum TaxID=322009 RepID=A0ABN6FMT0_SINCY|nr:gluconate:H+ symporter [Corynebacterium cyclohexanicum]BCT78179.1 2-keto-3-deoxygluconate permease [Corynebacterium cyclohexanicum]